MAISVDIKVSGGKLVAKAMKGASKGYVRAMGAAVYQQGLRVDVSSVLRTPVDTGRLRASHYVGPPTGRNLEVEVGNGTDYAVFVHERTELNHAAGTGAKFLKKAIDEVRRGYARKLLELAQANFEAKRGVDAIPATAPTRPKD